MWRRQVKESAGVKAVQLSVNEVEALFLEAVRG